MELQKTIGFLLYGGVLLWFGLYSEQKPYMKKLQKSYKVKKIPLKPFLYKGLKLGYYGVGMRINVVGTLGSGILEK